MQKKTLTRFYWTITILFVLFMTFGAVSELMQTESSKKIMTDLGYPLYVNTIIGIAKILGGIALLQWSCKALKEWAYAGFTIDILGASASMYFAGFGIGVALFTLVFLIPLFGSYWLWKKTSTMK